MAAHDYELSIDLNALNQLGINLYSNMPAVISEVVANSWDAENVRIFLDNTQDTITISDDGTGMSKRDINQRYLKVGYCDYLDGQEKLGRIQELINSI